MNKLLKSTALLASLFCATSSYAAIQSHTFSVTGDNGESGTGTFTWDDTVVPNGSTLSTANMLSLTYTITGGNVSGGSVTYTLADCSFAIAEPTPSFTSDINFECNLPGNVLSAIPTFTASLNGSTLTLSPGTTTPAAPVSTSPNSIPTMPVYALILTMLGLGWLSREKLKSAKA